MVQQMVQQQAENQLLLEILAKTNDKIKVAPYIDSEDIDTFLDICEATMRIHNEDSRS